MNRLSSVFALVGMLSAPVAAAALEKVNASYGAISGSMAQTWVAKEARLYEKHGLDLNLVYISGGLRSIMSLIGGSVQFVNHSGMPALEAYQRGADTALFASPTTNSNIRWWSRKTLRALSEILLRRSPSRRSEQLRGKVLGMSTAGSLTDIPL